MTNYLKTIALGVIASLSMSVSAQSYVTYAHDETKMNQITVQETGTGTLKPSFYYQLFHNSYQKSAAPKNKLGFRTLAGIAAYPQVEDADSVKSSLESRAKIEALNIADRQIDIAWLAEGAKINSKLQDFQNNINRIIRAGGRSQDKERWNDYYNMFQCAIKATQNAYMPNAQRKKEYLAIYADINKQNETLISYLVTLSKRSKTADLLSASYQKPNHKASIATAAHNRWRDASWKAMNAENNTSGGSGGSSGTITVPD